MKYSLRSLIPKLHLRDLFWLTAVCALAVGWWKAASDHDKLKRESELYRGIRVILTQQAHSGIDVGDDGFIRIDTPFGTCGYRLPDDLPTSKTPAPNPPED